MVWPLDRRTPWTLGLAAATILAVACSAQSPTPAPGSTDAAPSSPARALHDEVPLFDGHNDLPWEMRSSAGYDFAARNIRNRLDTGHTDIPRLREGGLGAQFWSVYVPASMQGDEAVSATLEQVAAVYEMTRLHPDVFELARTADDVERIFGEGKIASMMGAEGGHSIDSSLGALRMFYQLGVRYMTLTHGRNVPWADSATDEPAHGGLTTFGEEVVREMNWLGMLVDLSHVSPDTMKDALRVSQAPVIFSHSSARALCDVPRNVPDDVLQLLPANGGIIMISFVPGFTSQAVATHGAAADAEEARLQAAFADDEARRQTEMAAWREANPTPRATVAQVADHIDHVRDIAGIDHIGLGGDFDGITAVVEGLEDVATYPALTAELLARGYARDDVKKILGLNVLRVLRAAEALSTTLQAERPASTATIERLDGE
jgi:membrane dipeptidase